MSRRIIKFCAATVFALLVTTTAPAHAQGPVQDSAGSVKVSASGFRLDRRTGEFAQRVVVENKGAAPVAKPLYVLEGLDTRVSVKATSKHAAVPGAVPTFAAGGRDGATLQPGERTEMVMRFRAAAEGVSLAYKPRISTPGP